MLSRFIARQTWIISFFSLIGAGFVLGVSLNVFIPETKLILNQLYVKKSVIIVGVRADVAFAKSSNASDKGEYTENRGNSETVELSVEQRIRNEAEKLGFQDVETLVAIAKCESSLKPECEVLNHPACVNTHNNSFDRGYFQISRRWHPEVSDECSFNLECATRATIEIQKKSSWNSWMCYSKI